MSIDSWSEKNEADFMRLMADLVGCPPNKLTDDKRLLHDLGVDGDDASELLSALMQRFGLDIGDFCFQDYFRGESTWCLLFPSQRLKTRKPLTIGTLRAAVVAGRLV